MRIVLLGPPGSGKAELSRKISEHYGMPVITVSSVMRRAAAESSELGRMAKEAMDTARVTDELLLALLRIQMPQMDLDKGFILVDLPKNAGQADVLDSVLSDLGAEVELAFNLEVDTDELMERLVGRITCDSCGAQYNKYVNPPLVDGVCDACGARVVRRPDDYEETISNRLRVYEGQMGPLLQYYQLSDKLRRVDADAGPEKAWKTVRKVIDGMPKRVPPLVESDAAPPAAAEATSAVGKVGSKTAKGRPAKVKAGSQPAEVTASPAGKPAAVQAKKAAARKATAKRAAAAPEKKAESRKAAAGAVAAAKAGAKKAVAKASGAKKAATGKSAAKKAVAKKSAATKAVPKKAAATKTVSKKVVAKKVAAKKAVAKKAAGKKKVAAKKAVAKKVIARAPAVKKAAAKKAVAKKAVAKGAKSKRTAARKTPATKPAAKKVVARKVAAKKTVAKKAAAKKTVARKVAAKKAPAKKAVARKKR